ncbi:MAG: hypothetical protein RSF79_28430, partial [Janthinobacterium sp.]
PARPRRNAHSNEGLASVAAGQYWRAPGVAGRSFQARLLKAPEYAEKNRSERQRGLAPPLAKKRSCTLVQRASQAENRAAQQIFKAYLMRFR